MSVELQEEFVTDEIHIHYRDFRISMDEKDSKYLLKSIIEANDNLLKFEKNNTYIRKSHSDRLINDFNKKNENENNEASVIGLNLIECEVIKSNFIKIFLKILNQIQNILKNEQNLKLNTPIPPIILSKKEGDYYYIIDGHHRFYTYIKNKLNKIEAVILDVSHEETID